MQGASPLDALFNQADANKDGKLTKEEVANFVWSHLSKADTNHDNAVTKDELKAYAKERFQAMRAEHREPHGDHARHPKHPEKKGATPAKPTEKPAPAAKPKQAENTSASKPVVNQAKSEIKLAKTPEMKLAKPVITEAKTEIKPAASAQAKPQAGPAVPDGNKSAGAKSARLDRPLNPLKQTKGSKAGTSAT